MRNIFILLLFLVSATGFAQYPDENAIKQYDSDYNYREYPIIKDSIKKPGIYKTFEEFRGNSPSLPLQNKIIPVEDKYRSGTFSEPFYFTSYRVDIAKEEAKEIGDVFGFSDGNKFYVTLDTGNLHRINSPAFYEVEYIGQYCVYDAMYVSTLDNFTFNIKGVFTIDMNTGDAQLLTAGRLKRIIADNKELLAEFKDSKNKKFENLKAFLLRYLKTKHP